MARQLGHARGDSMMYLMIAIAVLLALLTFLVFMLGKRVERLSDELSYLEKPTQYDTFADNERIVL